MRCLRGSCHESLSLLEAASGAKSSYIPALRYLMPDKSTRTRYQQMTGEGKTVARVDSTAKTRQGLPAMGWGGE